MPKEVVDRSARRADYLGPKPTTRQPMPADLAIAPCASLEPLAEVRGALKKLKHDKNFLAKIFDTRDKQLFPRDIMVATVSTKKGGNRPVALLRRSFCFDKVKNCRALSIDFVWVMPAFRSCGIGRLLLQESLLVGRPKDVHLQVAGSEANTSAVGLYKSFGFVWDDAAPDKTEMVLEAASVEAAICESRERATAPPTPPPPTPPPWVTACLVLNADAEGYQGIALRLDIRPMPKATGTVHMATHGAADYADAPRPCECAPQVVHAVWLSAG